MMSLSLRAEPVPIRIDDTGIARVGKTRVTLDTVVYSFREGATPEEIVHKYPSLQLADVYAVIAYYLRAQPEVDVYLAERERNEEAVRRENEARFDPIGIRARLLARRKEQA